jgi:hypothetical protein
MTEKRRMSDNGDKEQIRQLEISVVRMEQRIVDTDKALVLAREISTAWQKSSNEWRDENRDQRALYPTLDKVATMIAMETSSREALEGRVRVLEQTAQALLGKNAGSGRTWDVALVVGAAIISLMMLIIHFIH